MAVVFLSIGSNLGNRSENIKRAIEFLEQTKGIKVKKVSFLYESKPQKAIGPDYLNGAIKIETQNSPKDLLAVLQKCEQVLGRVRTFKNAPRIIDLDILLYDEEVVDETWLSIPHPKMFERDFVMKPLLEIEPQLENTLKNLKMNINQK